MTARLASRVILAISLFLAPYSTVSAVAQGTTGTISGTVTDEQGGA